MAKKNEIIANNITDVIPEKSAKKKITLSITQEDSDKVKMYAIQQHTTVSDLFHKWISEKC